MAAFIWFGGGKPLRTAWIYAAICISTLATSMHVSHGGGVSSVANLVRSDWLSALNMFFIAPVGGALAIHFYLTIHKSVGELREERLPASGISAPSVLDGLLRRLASKTMPWTLLLPAIAMTSAGYLTGSVGFTGPDAGITGAIARLFILLNYWAMLVVAYHCVLVMVFLRALGRLATRIRPLHPDKIGGLASVGRLSLSVNYFSALIVAFFSLLLVFDEIAKSYWYWFLSPIASYVFAIVSFFWPLAPFHEYMERARDKLLMDLAIAFEKTSEKLSIDRTTGAINMEISTRLVRISELYDQAAKMPVWPFDAPTLWRFLSAVSIPFVTFLADHTVRALSH